MCKIHTISKSASINRENNLNEYLQYLTNAQILYWNLIGQKKLNSIKIATSEYSKVRHNDLISTSLLRASGRLQIEGRKTADQHHTDQKPTALCRMNFIYAILLTISLYIQITSHSNSSRSYCEQFPRKNHSWSQDGTTDRLMPTKP